MTEINNVNFRLLLESHNGDMGKALAAWQRICSLGGYGDVSPQYEGGLDVKGLMHGREGMISEDALKRLQDLVSGDNPAERIKVYLSKGTPKQS